MCSQVKKKEYISKHLQHEFRLFLTAVHFWQYLGKSQSGFIINIARDSVCVHFRNLLKFFTIKSNRNDVSVTDFGLTKPYDSDYKEWLGTINEALLHISPQRHNPKPKKADLNNQILQFKQEVLKLWKKFEEESNYTTILEKARNQATRESSNDLQTYLETQEV